MSDETQIRPLAAADLAPLSKLLLGQRPEYIAHFHPFAFDETTLSAQFSNATRDRFWTLWSDAALAGFFMMRGLDAGYTRPSFGIFVAEEFSGHGLARAALRHSLEWAASENIPVVMLTVHGDNQRAVAIYKDAGFQPTGEATGSGLPIYIKHISNA
jgi:RimJ/RimL family protein N-acetyltransferase